MENSSGAGADGWQGSGEFTSPDGLIVLSVAYDDEDFHIDARPGHKPAVMKCVLAQARSCGLEPMDADECEPELLEDGTVRIYLVFAEAEPETAERPIVANLQEKRRQSSAKRMALAFVIAASVATAILLPSPLRFDYTDRHKAEPVEQHAPAQPILVPSKGN